MSTYALEGFQAVAQRYISKSIAPQQYFKSAILYMLAGLTAGFDKEPLKIGRLTENSVFAGVPLSKAAKMALRGVNSYNPRIQAFKTHNTTILGARPTMPTVANPTTNSHSQATQAAAEFHWTKMATPLLVWHEDLERAIDGNEGRGREGQGVAVGQLVEEASRVGLEEHYDQLACRLLYGTASSDQDSDPWLDYLGIIPACSSTGTYGRVDRAQLAAGHPWKGNTITSATKDITWLIDYCRVTLKIGALADGPYLVLVGGDNYLTFKNQILARGGVIMQSAAGLGLPEMAKIGVEREVLRKDNAFIMWEPMLDTVPACTAGTTTALYTAQPTYAIVLNLAVWKWISHPRHNCTVSPFVNIADKAEGAKDADQGFVTTKGILACDRPAVNAIVTSWA